MLMIMVWETDSTLIENGLTYRMTLQVHIHAYYSEGVVQVIQPVQFWHYHIW